MPISKIKTDGIQDDAVTSPKFADNPDFDGQFVRVPHGTTAQRPGSPLGGYLRFNTELGTLEQYNTITNAWQAIDSPPIISALAYTGSTTGADVAGGETITLSGTNFKSGITVTVGGTTAPSVSIVSTTSITFTTPAKTAGDYDVVVTNPNGLSATLSNGISYNGVPAFSTAAGNLGTLNPNVTISTITIVAAEPDGGTLAYSVTSGALPTGLSLGSANGQITGTTTGPAADTTSNFTITATDDENQTNSRAFNLIVLRPVFNLLLNNSVRLDSTHNTYLNRDNRLIGSGMPQGGDTFTISCWVKKSNDSSNDIFLVGSETGTSARFLAYVNGNNLRFYGRNSSASVQFDVIANNVIKDSTSWYHVMLVFDATNSTANDTTRFYVNGVRVAQGSITTTNVATGNSANGTGLQDYYIGRHQGVYSDGYVADYHFIWNVAKTDPFEFIASYRGVVVPKAYTGSHGTYGFHLDFADSALTAAGIGDDNAGVGDFTPHNFPDAAAYSGTASVLTDTPTSNHSTLQDYSRNGPTINKGMMRSTKSSARYFVFGNVGIREGKWYWEMRSTDFGDSGGVVFGMMPVAESARASADGGDLYGWGALSGRIQNASTPYYFLNGGSQTVFGSTSSFSSTDTVGFSMDFDNHQFKIYKTTDGSVVVTIDTSSVTSKYDQHGTGVGTYPWYLPAGGCESGTGTRTIHWNFGQNSFEISGGIPSGFKSISEANNPESTISPLTSATLVASGGFKAKTYTGNGGTPGTQSINVGFRPDLVILKSRTQTYHPVIMDSIQGDNKYLHFSVNNAQATFDGTSQGFTFESTGFQVLATGGSGINESGQGADNMMSYSWKAGGVPSATNTNTSGAMTANSVSLNGSLQSSYTPSGSPTVYPKKMSVNTDYGFSIVQWNTGSNGNTMTIPHGLGKAPKVIWQKGEYDNNSYNWDSLFQWLPSGGNQYNGHLGRVILNSNDDFENLTGDVPWGDTRPSNDVFTSSNSSASAGDWYGLNKNVISYCWTDIPGYSDFGFYRGNGQSIGTYVYTGFKPAFVLIKNVSSNSTQWSVWDEAGEDDYNKYRRTTLSNIVNNTNTATTARLDFMSGGFRSVGGSGTLVNTDGDAYVYMAFASLPAKYALPTHNLGD